MKIYNSCLKEFLSLLDNETNPKSFPLDSSYLIGEPNQMVFRSDCAFELGGSNKAGYASSLLTSDSSLIGDEGVILYGPDIKDIESDAFYARMALIEVDDELMGEGKELYSSIRKIDYVRYHVSLDQIMFRISPLSFKESIVIGKKAKKNGLSFKDIGKAFIDAYHSLKQIKKVKMIFITDPNFDFESMSKIIKRSEDITKALDHLTNKVKMDCHSCGLQKICEEVETLSKSEFGKE